MWYQSILISNLRAVRILSIMGQVGNVGPNFRNLFIFFIKKKMIKVQLKPLKFNFFLLRQKFEQPKKRLLKLKFLLLSSLKHWTYVLD